MHLRSVAYEMYRMEVYSISFGVRMKYSSLVFRSIVYIVQSILLESNTIYSIKISQEFHTIFWKLRI